MKTLTKFLLSQQLLWRRREVKNLIMYKHLFFSQYDYQCYPFFDRGVEKVIAEAIKTLEG